MTTTDDRPTTSPARASAAAAGRARRWWGGWRLALRTARREAAEAKLRTALVAVLIGLPIVGAAAWDVDFRSNQRSNAELAADRLGSRAQAWLDPVAPGRPVVAADLGNGPAHSPSPDEQVTPPAEVEALLARVLPPGDRLVARAMHYGLLVRGGDRTGLINILEWDYRETPGVVAPTSGRPPAAAGEIVLTDEFANRNELGIGDRLTLPAAPAGDAGTGDGDRQLTLVGTYRPGRHTDDTPADGIAFPASVPRQPVGHVPSPWGPGGNWNQYRDWYVVGPEPVTDHQLAALAAEGIAGVSRQDIAGGGPPETETAGSGGAIRARGLLTGDGAVEGALITAVLVGLLLLQVAMMAGPALAVGARRNRRTLALLAACGGDPRQLRRHVLATGLLAGLAGSLAGAAVGAALGAWVHRLAADRDGLVPLPTRIHLGDLAVLVAVGTLTAVAASLLPARQVARADVVATLTGRPATSRPRLRVPVTGLLLAVAGAGLAVWAGLAELRLPFVLGVALGEIGLVMAAGAAVALAARAAGRLPIVARLALRDASRNRSRTAPAVAAAMAAIAGGTGALVYAASAADHDSHWPGFAPPGVVLVHPVNLPDGAPAPDWTGVRDAVTAELPTRTSAPLTTARLTGEDQLAVSPAASCLDPSTGPSTGPCSTSWARDRTVLMFQASGWVDDGSALDMILGGTDPEAVAALRAGRAVVWDPAAVRPGGLVRLTAGDRQADVPAHLARGPVMLRGVVLSADAARQLELPVRQTGLVVATTRMPTSSEEERASAAYQRSARVFDGLAQLQVERSRGDGGDGVQLLGLVGVALVVTLAGTLTAAGLAAAEGRRDRDVLAAVGAAPWLARRLAAAQALVISGLGTVLGVTAGTAAGCGVVWLLQERAGSGPPLMWNGTAAPDYRLVLPWGPMLLLAVSVPLLTTVAGALVAPRARRPGPRRPR